MEINGGAKMKLKDRLVRLFRRNSCNSGSATSVALSSANTSSRTLLSDAARNNHPPPSRSLSALDHRKEHAGPVVAVSGAATARVSLDCGVCRPNRDDFASLRKSNPVQVQPLPLINGRKGRRARKTLSTGTGTGECRARSGPPVSPSSPANHHHASISYRIYRSLNKDGKTRIKKRLCTNGYGFSESSSSSPESDDGRYGLFSSDDGGGGGGGAHKAETETFFSSKSFSSDSSEFYRNNSSKKKKRSETTQRRGSRRRRRRVSSCHSCTINEGFQPLISVASKEKNERIKKGFAVVKKSSDPYADFRNSMVEMIIERQIFGTEDLEKLLHSYLSLNSPRHHPVILQAFSDIWVVLFGN